jgi:hypothetical protein
VPVEREEEGKEDEREDPTHETSMRERPNLGAVRNEKCRAVRAPELPLQRNARASRRTVPSPTRSNRLGVTVPFRVLPGSEVAGVLGYLLPVRPRRSQNARSFRYSFLHPHPRTRLLGRSSHGVRLSFTVCPEVPAPGLSTEGTSLGVSSPLQRSGRRESTSRSGCPARAPWWCQGVRQRVPPRQLRCRSQVFPTSQRLVPLPAFPPFSDGWRSWGSALQGVVPSTKPRRLVAAGMPS